MLLAHELYRPVLARFYRTKVPLLTSVELSSENFQAFSDTGSMSTQSLCISSSSLYSYVGWWRSEYLATTKPAQTLQSNVGWVRTPKWPHWRYGQNVWTRSRNVWFRKWMSEWVPTKVGHIAQSSEPSYYSMQMPDLADMSSNLSNSSKNLKLLSALDKVCHEILYYGIDSSKRFLEDNIKIWQLC